VPQIIEMMNYGLFGFDVVEKNHDPLRKSTTNATYVKFEKAVRVTWIETVDWI